MLQRWEYLRLLVCPATMFKKPWESPQPYCKSSHSGGNGVPNLATLSAYGYFLLKSQHCPNKSGHTGNVCWESEARGTASWASHLKDLAIYLSRRPLPFKNSSDAQPFDDTAECKGPRDGHILLTEVLVTEEFLERQVQETHIRVKVI